MVSQNLSTTDDEDEASDEDNGAEIETRADTSSNPLNRAGTMDESDQPFVDANELLLAAYTPGRGLDEDERGLDHEPPEWLADSDPESDFFAEGGAEEADDVSDEDAAVPEAAGDAGDDDLVDLTELYEHLLDGDSDDEEQEDLWDAMDIGE